MARSWIYALSFSNLPNIEAWQRMIDQLDLISPVELVSPEMGREGSRRMRLGDRMIRFSCDETAIGTLLDCQATNRRWPRAYGFGDYGRHIESTAATIACLSFAVATGGAVLRAGTGPMTDLSGGRREIDLDLAYDTGREEAFLERYPDTREAEPAGPATLAITRTSA